MNIKKVLASFIVILAVVSLASCNGNTSKSVADKFLTSFYDMDYEEAKKYATDKTKSMLTTIDNLKPKFLQNAQGGLKDVKVEIVDVKEEGDKAVVTYNISDGVGMATKNIANKKLHLIKEKGEWKVNFTKENNMEDIKALIEEDAPDSAGAQQ